MKTKEFDFFLPDNLIAQYPPKERGASRLMTLDRQTKNIDHKTVSQLPQILCDKRFLSPNGELPLLVFNDTKVRKARLIGRLLGPGTVKEFLLLEENEAGEWKTLVKRFRRFKIGSRFYFNDINGNDISTAGITGKDSEYIYLKFDRPVDDNFFDKFGHIPLPPYIKRKDESDDANRYQTVYAKETGSAAAPTAGLHFTDELLQNLASNGIGSAFITLHVGLGTFLPVRSEEIEDHIMHEEKFIITENNASIIEDAIAKKRKIIAVGTTSLRCLESAVLNEQLAMNNEQRAINKEQLTMNNEQIAIRLRHGWNNTSIFIYPGYNFKVVDALFTNFHTPLSTLLMLVCAFAGKDFILESYNEAVQQQYKFFSYGDAMLIS